MKSKLCQCKLGQAKSARLAVGDRVVCTYGNDPSWLVRTITHVDPVVPYTTSIGVYVTCFVTADGGPLCKNCGLAKFDPRINMIDSWFRKASKKEINLCEEVCQ